MQPVEEAQALSEKASGNKILRHVKSTTQLVEKAEAPSEEAPGNTVLRYIESTTQPVEKAEAPSKVASGNKVLKVRKVAGQKIFNSDSATRGVDLIINEIYRCTNDAQAILHTVRRRERALRLAKSRPTAVEQFEGKGQSIIHKYTAEAAPYKVPHTRISAPSTSSEARTLPAQRNENTSVGTSRPRIRHLLQNVVVRKRPSTNTREEQHRNRNEPNTTDNQATRPKLQHPLDTPRRSTLDQRQKHGTSRAKRMQDELSDVVKLWLGETSSKPAKSSKSTGALDSDRPK